MDDSLYDRGGVQPMVAELNTVGVNSLTTAEEVDAALSATEGTVLVVVNSVCGCAAGNARPGVTRALQHKIIPDKLVTVFAGVDRAATDRARHYMTGIAPSSPCIALFKDGKVAHILERRHIEMINEMDVANSLIEAFDKNCSREGPSVEPDVYANLNSARQCGQSVPRNEQ